jgi:hypothetical protein
MKTSFWTMFFSGIFLLSVISPPILPRKFTNTLLPVQKKSMGVENVTTPICLDRSDIPKEELHWLYIPNDPSQLATHEYYGYLSGQLITAGVVDASDCPLNGLWPNGYANSCGLEKTREVSLYLQNVYDDEILAAGKGIGVPPVMIKQLIRYESQFWPVRMGLYHFGLGHLTFVGASNALTWSRALYEDAYARLPPETTVDKTALAAQLLLMMDASCPTCPFKIDIAEAERSITYIAEALLGYCRQTSLIVYNATKKNAGDAVDYATIWQLTLLNYNSGPLCVYDAVAASYRSGDTKKSDKLSWDVIADSIEDKRCLQGALYVEDITREYYDFGITP